MFYRIFTAYNPITERREGPAQMELVHLNDFWEAQALIVDAPDGTIDYLPDYDMAVDLVDEYNSH